MSNEIASPALAPPALRAFFSVAAQVCCAAIALFVVVTTVFGKLPAEAQYTTALTLGLIAVFLSKPGPLARAGTVTSVDAGLSFILAAAAIGTGAYYIVNYHAIAAFREGIPNSADLVCYAIGTLIVLEAARRVEGWVLVGIAAAAFLYLAFGHLMPGVLRRRPMPLSNALVVDYSY
ncbi:MAG: hypothetical protein ACQRW7_09565, partial [Caulobacterales bacterium]